MPVLAAWGYVLLWPVLIAVTITLSLWRGSQSAIDVWLLTCGLAIELVLAFTGLLHGESGACTINDRTLLISNHVGNIVTSTSFAVACLVAYLTFSGPTLAMWISDEADEMLRHFGLIQDDKYLHATSNAASHAAQVFEACLGLPLTVKQIKRLKASRGQGTSDNVQIITLRKKRWREAAGYLKLGPLGRHMIEGRADQWLAAGGIWLMIFITGQALVLFLAEVIVGDRRVACWLSLGRPFFNDLPIEVGYGVSFLGIIIGVGLFRFRIMIQTALEVHLAENAHDLSLQLLKPSALAAIERAGA